MIKLTKTDRLIAVDSILDWPSNTEEELRAMIEGITWVVRYQQLKPDDAPKEEELTNEAPAIRESS